MRTDSLAEQAQAKRAAAREEVAGAARKGESPSSVFSPRISRGPSRGATMSWRRSKSWPTR